MYSTGLIQHEGVTYSPDGRVTLGESETLDCGHSRPPVEKGAFSVPWGIVQTSEGPAEYCLACCHALEVEALRVLPVGAPYAAYYVENEKEDGRYRGGCKYKITTWEGQTLMRVVDWSTYRHNFGGRFIAISAVDVHGYRWHGRASFDWGNIIRLRKNKVQPTM